MSILNKTSVESILEHDNTEYPQKIELGTTFGLFRNKSNVIVEGDKVEVKMLKGELVFPYLTHVFCLRPTLSDALEGEEDMAVFKVSDTQLVLGNSNDVLLLPLAISLTAKVSDLEEGTILFSPDEDYDLSSDSITAYTKYGVEYKVPQTHFKLLNFEEV